MTEDRPKGRAQWVVILVIAIALLLSAGWMVRIQSAVSEPMCQEVFSDGTKLDVVGASIGERAVDFGNGGGFLRWLRGTSIARWMGVAGRFGSTGASTYQTDNFLVERFEDGGRVFKCRAWDQGSGSAMLMEIRVRNSDGSPKLMPAFYNGEWGVFDDERLGPREGVRFFRKTEDATEDWAKKIKEAKLQILIQHHDPAAGWVHLAGPYLFNESEKDRYMLVLPAWKRDLTTLDFRAIQPDGSIVGFSTPNPDFKKAATRPAAVPLPAVHKAPDFSFALRLVERDFCPGYHPFTWFETELEMGGEPVGKDGLWPVKLSVEGSTAEDEWGNTAALAWDTVKGKERGVGVRFPAAARHLSLNFMIERTIAYPRMQTAGSLVMEGVVQADGKTVDFTLLPDAAKFGITAAPVGNVKPIDVNRGDPRKDWLSVTYPVSYKIGQSERESLVRDFGEPNVWQFLAFSGDDFESAGQPVNYGMGGTTSPTIDIQTTVCWNAPPEMLRAGARFRIGIFPPLPSETVKFEIEAPALAK